MTQSCVATLVKGVAINCVLRLDQHHLRTSDVYPLPITPYLLRMLFTMQYGQGFNYYQVSHQFEGNNAQGNHNFRG